MRCHSRMAFRIVAPLFVLLVACTSGDSTAPERTNPAPVAGADATFPVTVGSFDFAESELLAELYSQALEGGGYAVRRAFNLGPREFVAPALARGLVDLVPEYTGTALQFLSLGRAQPGADPAAAREALVQALAGTGVTALEAAPAQDANTFVVTRETAERLGLRRLSDLAAAAPGLTFGGSPECATRPLCIVGLERVYAVRFKEVVALDAGGPLSLQALRAGAVDVALLFTTDPTVAEGTL
ncbi:MAG: osmoprotectant transport system substrate-binding protein, partial [Actinomycetota bacterium]|nr:osmoprotectant transport system substrate-binding protein [Actinomycetota bacterium]